MKKPREFWINQSRCNGNVRAYHSHNEMISDTQINDEWINVREVVPIDWNKIWSDKRITARLVDSILIIEQLVETQLKGGE